MRTIMIIVGGFVLLGLSVLTGRWVGGTGRSMEGVSKMLIPC